MFVFKRLVALSGVILAAVSGQAAVLDDPARVFGLRESVEDIALSPDGRSIVYVTPGPGQMTVAMVADAKGGGQAVPVARADGKPMRLIDCGFAAADRLVCRQYGVSSLSGERLGFVRLVATDLDGKNMRSLGQQDSSTSLRLRQYDGEIIDWLAGDGAVLMSRQYVPDKQSGTRVAATADGLGVDRVDTRTSRNSKVEAARREAAEYLSDGRGVVRLMRMDDASSYGQLLGVSRYLYRTVGEREWKPFSTVKWLTDEGLRPIAIDPSLDMAYSLKSLNGRDALYRVTLDGSMREQLVYAHPEVDVDGVITIGRGGRVIGAAYATDHRRIEYFDPDYRKLGAALSKALPGLPLIDFVSASADESVLLIRAGSDVDPGKYYSYDKRTRSLAELLLSRPQLEGVPLAQVKAVSYPSEGGVMIPAYLTLPAGSTGKGLPAIVLPHGGPAARDEWGFDWLAQYFAHRGYAVLQPNFRGSSGYGDAWFVDNGFKSWNLAIADVIAGGKWLISQGIADPKKLAILGWSYGGYAALQSNVIDPDLFKATVAIAPVADLQMLKGESYGFTNSAVVRDYIGSGAHIVEGSPARHADRFKAPVLMFHGDQDINVSIAQSRTMDERLRKAGKRSELVVYPELDHQLPDGAARADMLRKADSFLRANLGM